MNEYVKETLQANKQAKTHAMTTFEGKKDENRIPRIVAAAVVVGSRRRSKQNTSLIKVGR